MFRRKSAETETPEPEPVKAPAIEKLQPDAPKTGAGKLIEARLSEAQGNESSATSLN